MAPRARREADACRGPSPVSGEAPPSRTFDKRYPDRASCARAVANYQWLASLPSPLRLPTLLQRRERLLRFELVEGDHVRAEDLVAVAAHMGEFHRTAFEAELHRADLRLDFEVTLPDGRRHRIPGFIAARLAALRHLASSRVWEEAVFDVSEACQRLVTSSNGQAALYKDSNPRNMLVTRRSGETTVTTVDFDDLTLAPLGYDLAKLVVTLTMTYGRLPGALIPEALAAYNASVYSPGSQSGPVTPEELMTWAEIHHILTHRYQGRHGYRHNWHELRPRQLPDWG